jgi:ATP-dependent RNA helicase RhlE
MYMQKIYFIINLKFVIGTPGRIIDLIRERALDLAPFHNIVLDEVDRMVDIGFIKDVQYLVSLLPQERHSLFFSATVTDKVNEILRTFVKNPVRISVKTANTAETIDQDIIRVNSPTQKIDMLHELLIKEEFEKVIVFARTKHGTEKLSRSLTMRGFRTAAIHGNKTQGQRQRALQAFKNNQVQILLATDVASRGIDVADVTHVINYDAPESYDDYVHRIGRTGRANKKGKAITFVE